MAAMSSMKLLEQLPLPKKSGSTYDSSLDSWFLNRPGSESALTAQTKQIKEPPPYGRRQGFVPRKLEDFGDGGAFPEIHVAQYPLDMGRKEDRISNKVLPLNVDGKGSVAFDAIVRQGENRNKTVFTQQRDLVPKLQDLDAAEDLKRPDDEEAQETTDRTRMALEKIVTTRLSAAQPKSLPGAPDAPTFIKYTPSQQGAAFNSGAKERVIRMVEMPKDPLEPPKFKHKRVPKASGSPPVPVMHSPPRPVTVKDQQDWKIPPCISNWKNPKGYTIPLDKRLAADGRGLQEVQINDNFARLSEALYVAENKAREAVEMRSKIQRELMLKEKEKKEQELRQLAQAARLERAGGAAIGGGISRDSAVAASVPAGSAAAKGPSWSGAAGAGAGGRGAEADLPTEDKIRGETRVEKEERLKREAIREERRRERERERRLEAKEGGNPSKKSKLTRDRDRDVSEKVALGLASTGTRGGEIMYDQRLFNQEKGMESGFAADDSYNVYDKPMFNREGAGGLFKVRKLTDDEMAGGGGVGEDVDQVLKSDRFRPDKGFAGATERGAPRDKPVEFEAAEADPFGLDQFLTQVRGKKATDKVGQSGTMRASGGSGTKDSYEGGSGRKRVDFERGDR